MSGIAGVVSCGSTPVDVSLLERWLDFLAFRGPEAQRIHTEDRLGFAHALLHTDAGSASASSASSRNDSQPVSLGGRLVVTADARLDQREDLASGLTALGHAVGTDTPDAVLLLHAFAAWDAECVQHLRGDFAFAIWDAQTRRLFCARDHFGIKPFYYASGNAWFAFSNTLDCLRLHPEVSARLYEPAIADFLLFGLNTDPGTTFFADIQRLPPAHALVFADGKLQVTRYWSPPADGRIRFRDPHEYVERFNEILHAAVSDRVRFGSVGIHLSGGLDSSAIAAAARACSPPGGLRAYTVVYEKLFPDTEKPFAQSVADALEIPIEFHPADHARLFDGWGDGRARWPEPVDDPLMAAMFDEMAWIAQRDRVVLSGEGNDNLMDFQMWPFLKDQLHRGEWGDAISNTFRFAWIRPFPWKGLQARISRWMGEAREATEIPQWIEPQFARRMEMQDRFQRYETIFDRSAHRARPRAWALLALPEWTHMFEITDPGVTRSPVETRYPFLDFRMVEYVLALPAFPWFFEKKLVRDAMPRKIPENIRHRRKTPLAGDPLTAALERPESKWVDRFEPAPCLNEFVIRKKVPGVCRERKPEAAAQNLRPLCLNFWLQRSEVIGYNTNVEGPHGAKQARG